MTSQNSGVSAMHMFIFPITNKAIMFDSDTFGPSQIQLLSHDCYDEPDCWAHAVEYDIHTAAVRPLKVMNNNLLLFQFRLSFPFFFFFLMHIMYVRRRVL